MSVSLDTLSSQPLIDFVDRSKLVKDCLIYFGQVDSYSEASRNRFRRSVGVSEPFVLFYLL